MKQMRFGSVCSGIEAASVAWEPLGWKAAWLSEIEPFPSAVLAHHYPDVPNLGDMTALPDRIRSGEVEAPDLFCGGTPCQAFSVAGLRKSLDDSRGNLSLTFCEIANAIDHVRLVRKESPCIVFWENVPGVLSTKDNAFGCFLAGLAGEDGELKPPGGKWTNAGCVFGPQRAVAWRVLDAQYFGVAQRRRRVFVVASARNDFDPATVLFEWDGVRRDSAPSREAREVAPTIPARSLGGGGLGADFDCDGGVIQQPSYGIPGNWIGRKPENGGNAVEPMHDVAPCLTKADQHGVAHPVNIYGGNKRADRPEGGFYVRMDEDTSKTLDAASGLNPTCSQGGTAVMSAMGCGSSGGQASVAVAFQQTADCLTSAYGTKWNGNASATNGSLFAKQAMRVRRLTPVECERLQGFPDGYTNIPWRKNPESPDGPRYKALGNSWAVPVVRWIGERINQA